MNTIVIGLGNPLLGDDGVGWRIAEALRQETSVEVDCLAVGGLALMERLVGYQRAILVDAICTGTQPEGTITCCALEDLPAPAGPHASAGPPASGGRHLASAHDASLAVAFQVGRALRAELPEQVIVLAVEAARVYDFSTELSPAVAAAVPRAVQRAHELLHGVTWR